MKEKVVDIHLFNVFFIKLYVDEFTNSNMFVQYDQLFFF